jgi:prepilin-type N-terminal cleavage/methylation domain-containing protein
MTGASRRLARQSGFTLLEFLIAITILTLFMTASLGAIRIASKSWAAGQERADLTEEMRSVTDFLRRQFAQMPPLKIGEGKDQRLTFSAGETGLRFVAPGPQYSFGAGLFVFTLAGEKVDGNESLTLRYAPFDPDSERLVQPASSKAIILAWGFEEISFQYYGSQTEKEPPAWHSLWNADADYYPLAVRIRTRKAPDGEGWPDLVYRLRGGERT